MNEACWNVAEIKNLLSSHSETEKVQTSNVARHSLFWNTRVFTTLIHLHFTLTGQAGQGTRDNKKNATLGRKIGNYHLNVFS